MPPRTDKRIQMVSVRGERQLTSQLTSAKAPGGAERPDFLGNHHLPAVELTTRQSQIDSKCRELPGLVTIVRHPLSFPCSVLPVVPFVSQKRPENIFQSFPFRLPGRRIACYPRTSTPYARKRWSAVTTVMLPRRAVAMMKRSAGSLWCSGRALAENITSGSNGAMSSE